ncbi:MAG: hypothetical protein Q7R76_02845 [Candidatus Woesearchaeota archaeon]|nr:hypothetical protein [Candidatus Woesearchaeota archaeon]
MKKILHIIVLIAVVFALSGCVFGPKKSKLVPDGPAQPLGSGASALSNSANTVITDHDEQELADLSRELDEDINFDDIEELTKLDI